MLSVIYVSKVFPGFDEQALVELTDQASAINKSKGITGMLAYNGMNFMQLLEGKERAVEAALDRISRDNRHSDMVIIRRDKEQPRECPDWSMRAFTLPLAGAGAADAFFRSLPEGFRADTRMVFTSFASLLKESA